MKRSKFSLSHYRLLSMDMGRLVPIGLTEVLPGDTMQQATSCLLRASPLMAPVMHPVHVRIHHWYVPFRLLWDDFEDFITGGPDGTNDSEFPTVTLSYQDGSPPTGSGVPGGLADYLGVPPEIDGLEVSALPFRAYALIFNEWYRDQDLVEAVDVSKESGPDSTTSLELLSAAWEKDYFTSARPFEQKGPAVHIPLGDTAPLTGDRNIHSTGEDIKLSGLAGTGQTWTNEVLRGVTRNASSPIGMETLGSSPVTNRSVGFGDQTGLKVSDDLLVDLAASTGVPINLVREAFALQRYAEARARYGSRYVEYLRYLGVRSSDARLQRPEYLGGGRQTIQWSEVLQTAEGTSPVGELRGHGIAAMRTNRYRRFFEEHGYVVSLMTVRPKTIYTQALPRTWNRRVKEDFWQRELQHIGQQEVLNKEVLASHSEPEGVFGFQDRYDEYRRAESLVCGEFRRSELDFWHFARKFEGDVALNGDFVTCTPTDRPFAVPSSDTLYVMANHSIQARRLVARSGKSYIY